MIGPKLNCLNLRLGHVAALAVLVGMTAVADTHGRETCRGVCRVAPRVVSRPVVHSTQVVREIVHQPLHAAPINNVFYGVGQPLVQEAMLTRAVQTAIKDHQFNATVQATVNGSLSTLATNTPLSTTRNRSVAQGESRPTLNAACLSCHSESRASGGFVLPNATDQQKLSAARRVLEGTMPPAGGLPAEQRSEVIRELICD